MNRLVLSGFLLAAIVAVGFSELCTPDQWEGVEASYGGYVHHMRPGIIKEHNFVAYDAKNQRSAAFITYINNDYENKFQIIIRYDSGGNTAKIYYVDLKRDKCWIKKLDKPFRKACLPDDAEHVHDYTMGPATGGLKVAGYLARKWDAGAYLAVVQDGDTIIPVTETVHGNIMGTSFIQGIQYAEIVPKIKNETVFDIPKQCKEDMEFAFVPEYIMRDYLILGV